MAYQRDDPEEKRKSRAAQAAAAEEEDDGPDISDIFDDEKETDPNLPMPASQEAPARMPVRRSDRRRS